MITGWLLVLALPIVVVIIGIVGVVVIVRERRARKQWASVQRMLCGWCSGPADLRAPVPRCTCFSDCRQPGCRAGKRYSEAGLG